MPPATPALFDRMALTLVVAVFVVPITYLEVAHPSWQQVRSSAHSVTDHFPHVTPGSQPATPATSTRVHSSAPTPAPAKTATTNSYVHLRAGKSVNSAIVSNIASGISVQLTSDVDPTWQGVTYQGKTGYIYRAYLTY